VNKPGAKEKPLASTINSDLLMGCREPCTGLGGINVCDPQRNLYLIIWDTGGGFEEGCDVTEVAFMVCSSYCKIQDK
jgi:hypothetical protein